MAFQSPQPPETHGKRHIQTSECCNVWVHSTTSLETRRQSLTRPPAAAGSGRANGSLTAKSGSRSAAAEAGLINHRRSCPVQYLRAPSCAAGCCCCCCWLLLDRSSSFITTVEAGLFRAAWWDPIRGASSRVGGAGRGPSILRPLESSIARACVQRPAPEGVRGHTGHRSRGDPSWESRKRVLNPTFISATPFSTQGVWTIAPSQKRFALPKDRPTADQST